MGKAKDILLRPIGAKEANRLVRRVHYSGKVVNNSQIHIGVFYNGGLHGALQFGPSLDKRKIQGLVKGTKWHEFIELNRLAFDDVLPRNSESRALSISFKLLRKHAPQLKWIISFADATQSGDGGIYRASGFVLTSIKPNDQIWMAPDKQSVATRFVATDSRRPGRQRLLNGARFSRTSLTDNRSKNEQRKARVLLSRGNATKGKHIIHSDSASPYAGASLGGSTMRPFIEQGWQPLDGFQLRYIYFLDSSYRQRLTVPELPYSAIDDAGARMYRGMRPADGSAEGDQLPVGGSTPTRTL